MHNKEEEQIKAHGRNATKRTTVDLKYKVFKSNTNIFATPIEEALNPYGKVIRLTVYKTKDTTKEQRNYIKVAAIERDYPEFFEDLRRFGVLRKSEYIEQYRVKYVALLQELIGKRFVHHIGESYCHFEDDQILNLLALEKELHSEYHYCKDNKLPIPFLYYQELRKRNDRIIELLTQRFGPEEVEHLLRETDRHITEAG
jgi:hypothetical protein